MSATILVVEDDLDFQAQLTRQLAGAGFKVLAAQDAGSARQIFAADPPDLAIVDLMLENHDDGFILCHHFKQAQPSIPIIIATSVARDTGISFDANNPAEKAWIKADALLHKPLRFETLHQEIRRLMHHHACDDA